MSDSSFDIRSGLVIGRFLMAFERIFSRCITFPLKTDFQGVVWCFLRLMLHRS